MRPRYILAVRVTDSTGKVNPATADVISDKLFGTYGDSFTMKSQMEACSFGSFSAQTNYPVNNISQHVSAPGVIDVVMNIPLLGNNRLSITDSARMPCRKSWDSHCQVRFIMSCLYSSNVIPIAGGEHLPIQTLSLVDILKTTGHS